MANKSKKFTSTETFRFIIAGISSTIADFISVVLVSFLVQKLGLEATNVWCTVISTTFGFLANMTVNYIFSVKWVYQDFDRKKMKEHRKRHVLIFVTLGAVGLFIGVGIMAIFKVSLQNGLNINIDNWMHVDMPSTYNLWQRICTWISVTFMNSTFWWFALAFIVKTLIVLIYNYISRKKVLFKNNIKNRAKKQI